jgi:translation initiation factor RLI1
MTAQDKSYPLVKILFPNLAPNLIKSNFENTKHFILNQFTKKKKKLQNYFPTALMTSIFHFQPP